MSTRVRSYISQLCVYIFREFSLQWWFWLCVTGVAFSCTLR